jgi:hypothetical protein
MASARDDDDEWLFERLLNTRLLAGGFGRVRWMIKRARSVPCPRIRICLCVEVCD